MNLVLFLLNAGFTAILVWLTLALWRQLPLKESETSASQHRWLMEWTVKGLAAPALIWVIINLGLVAWLPPFIPQVEHLKNIGEPWVWASLGLSSRGLAIMASYWAAVSLLMLMGAIWRRIEDRGLFWGSLLLWTLFTLPVTGLLLFAGGWMMAGVAGVVWLAAAAYGTMPATVPVRHLPSYAQAIARIKFGRYADAEMEVLKQLERCENDFDGWMMLAELYAFHFHEFEQAEQTIIDLCDQPGMTASQVAVALHRLADWHLQLRRDPRAARRCLEAISKRHPGTHLDKMARLRRDRIAETPEALTAPRLMRQMDEQERVTRLSANKRRPGIVVRLDPPPDSAAKP